MSGIEKFGGEIRDVRGEILRGTEIAGKLDGVIPQAAAVVENNGDNDLISAENYTML